jgi:outer membrane protein
VPLLELATLKRLNIEVGLNARIYDAEATVVDRTSNLRESESETMVVPMGYLGVSLQPVDRIALEGEARGVTYSDTDVYSLIGRVRVNTFGPTFVTGGYRYEKLDSQDWDLKFDMDFSGPFFEAGLSF